MRSNDKWPLSAAQNDATQGCKICASQEHNKVYAVRERMIGFGHEFHYLHCGNCGVRQLLDPPLDWEPYYPSANYRPFSAPSILDLLRIRLCPLPWLQGLDKSARILDVGAGSGKLVYQLRSLGFKNAIGLDRFFESQMVRKGVLTDITEVHDLIIFHHAFEHMEDPIETMTAASRLLKDGGRLIISIPIADSWACVHYGPHWVQHDAPRHIFLHTRKSMALLATMSGLKIEEIVCDSYSMQFWGSELYVQGKNLVDNIPSRWRLYLDPNHLRMRRKANALNAANMGDQARFTLKREKVP